MKINDIETPGPPGTSADLARARKSNKISTISNGFDGGDGLAYKDGIIYVSSWKKGIVYRVENGKVSTFADGFSAAADIALSLDKKKLMIPDMKGGTVTIIKAE